MSGGRSGEGWLPKSTQPLKIASNAGGGVSRNRLNSAVLQNVIKPRLDLFLPQINIYLPTSVSSG